MYKLVSVCLAFSLIISAADVKTVEQVKTVEVKKAKPSSGEDLLIKTSHTVSSIKQEVSTKKIKKKKENELSAQKKEALYNRLNEEKGQSTEIQANNEADHAIAQENIEEFDKSLLIEKLETGIKEQSYSSPAYIQGPRKANNPNIHAVREHESVFFSEVAEGTSYNKYIEIYNGTGSNVDLSGYSLSSCSNGCDTENQFDYPDNVTFFMPYYEMTETGSISWDVTLAEAGTYSLVVHNRAPYGTKGNHVRVNGVGLKNRTTNGEWMFDYNYPEDGSFLATVVSEDSLVDVTGTPLQLAAGTHTISIEKSWGYMDFGNVEVYSGDAATTGTLVAVLAVDEAVADGVTLASVDLTEFVLDTVLTTNIYNLSHAEVLGYMEDSGITSLDVMWNVYTDDGFDTTPSSNGPWSLTIDGGWALSVDNNTLPEVFALHNNYPNPFNPITNIRYDIPEASDVRIDIYDIVGKKVKTLVSKQHQPGRYKIQWNATNEFGSAVATGMYIYKIQAKDFVSVKKLLLMK